MEGLVNFADAQNNFKGLFSATYLEVNGKGDLKQVNSPLSIVYNSSYCRLSISGVVNNFKVDAYSKKLSSGDVEESFLSDETATTPRGWYYILITHNNLGTSTITVNLPMIPNGNAYIVNKAEIFTENGKVTGKVHVENWKEIENEVSVNDSIVALKEKNRKETELKERIEDSISSERKFDEQLNAGENLYNLYYSHPDENQKLIQKIRGLKTGLLHNNLDGYDILVYIDKEGYVTECKASNSRYDSYMPLLNEYFKKNKYQVSPYIYFNGHSIRNGNKYPAFIKVR
ncbi:MAG: hypothetical protein NTY88_08280 [Bacteroidetes bacterium]|nr:hypothetical protein [Bacteroidota bacterium]